MTKKNKEASSNGDTERNELFVQQLKIVALNSRLEAINQRQQAILAESSLIEVKKPEVERERDALLAEYKPRYEKLKTKMEVPEGSDLNLETGEVVASPSR